MATCILVSLSAFLVGLLLGIAFAKGAERDLATLMGDVLDSYLLLTSTRNKSEVETRSKIESVLAKLKEWT